jgi:rhodanese-related sulfurtransferase
MQLFYSVAVILFVLLEQSSFATDKKASEIVPVQQNDLVSKTTYLPYCGIHAVCLAVRGMGREVEFSSFVKPKYLGTKKGSSLPELESLCSDINIYSKKFQKLTLSTLSYAEVPLILHTTSLPGSGEYNHWILCTGIQNGKANIWKIVNSQAVLEQIDMEQLAARWDGVALMVSDNRNSITKFVVAVWMDRIVILALLFLLFILIKQFQQQKIFSHTSLYFRETFIFLLIPLIIYAGDYVLLPKSFFTDKGSIQKIQENKIITFYPIISIDLVRQQLKRREFVLIDVRSEFDYRSGHIQGSIHVPYFLSLTEIENRLSGITIDKPLIIVYQPIACSRASDAFQKIQKLGYRRIYRFENGWDEWQKIEQNLIKE